MLGCFLPHSRAKPDWPPAISTARLSASKGVRTLLMRPSIDLSIGQSIDKSNYAPIGLAIGSMGMDLGSRMKKRMELAGISQAALARRVGITQPSINHLIRQGAQGSKHLHKIARVLGTTPEYLTGETNDPDLPAGLADRQSDFGHFPAVKAETQHASPLIAMMVALPSEDALAAMFEGMLAIVPDGSSRSEAARILAQRLPSGFAAIGPYAPDQGAGVAIGAVRAGRSRTEDHP